MVFVMMPSSDSSPPAAGVFDIRVLGCKVNQYEAQQIRRTMELQGLQASGSEAPADVVVIHTCAVTSQAVKKSRQAVRRASQDHPNARIVITGCAASEDLLKDVAGVTDPIGPRENWLSDFSERIGNIMPGVAAQPAMPIADDHLGVKRFVGQARAFLKVQDGCDIGCTFCIVPRLRRKPRDKPLSLIVEEAHALAESGHREIVISGVSVGLYGRDRGDGSGLAGVLSEVIGVPGIERIRLSSLHPRELTPALLEVWASSPKMMPHIHLPLQAGSDRVLADMNRGYTSTEFIAAVEQAREVLDDPAFNADVIVGFPGETEADFGETIRVARRVAFSRMHVFPYSPRPHTRAARRTARVSSGDVKERCRRLRAVAEDLAVAHRATYRGGEARVLAERYDPERLQYQGYTERYIPVRFAAPPGLSGEVVRVRLSDTSSEPVGADWIAPARAEPLPARVDPPILRTGSHSMACVTEVDS